MMTCRNTKNETLLAFRNEWRRLDKESAINASKPSNLARLKAQRFHLAELVAAYVRDEIGRACPDMTYEFFDYYPAMRLMDAFVLQHRPDNAGLFDVLNLRTEISPYGPLVRWEIGSLMP